MTHIPDISVVVAVYGVEQWIEESMRSLLSQDIGDEEMEVVVVDDCSPDRSMELARKVFAEFPHRRIKVIEHSRNMGVGATRAEAVKACTGRYIIHFDPDDLLATGAYTAMLDEARRTGAHITICDFEAHYPGKMSWVDHQRPNSTDGQTALRQLCGLEGPSLHGSLANKLIKTELYQAVDFPEGIDMCEDALTLGRMLQCPDTKVAYLPKPFYIYRMRRGSVSSATSDERMTALFRLLFSWGDDCWKAYACDLLYHRIYMSFRGNARQFAERYGEFYSGAMLPVSLTKVEKNLFRKALAGKMLLPRLGRILTDKSLKIYKKLCRN